MIAAQRLSPSIVKCRSPGHEPGNASLAVTGNGVDFIYSAMVYEYSALPVVLEILPSVAASHGGSIVTVRGSGFENGLVFCQFGLDSPSLVSIFASSTQVMCTSPAHGQGATDLLIGYEDSSMFFSQQSFVFFNTPVTRNVKPSSVSMSGGTVLTVTGDFAVFHAAMCCFGSISSSGLLKLPCMSLTLHLLDPASRQRCESLQLSVCRFRNDIYYLPWRY